MKTAKENKNKMQEVGFGPYTLYWPQVLVDRTKRSLFASTTEDPFSCSAFVNITEIVNYAFYKICTRKFF